VDCQCAGAQPFLSETTATHLYRIAQEAITNAVKHGKATRIDIRCAIAQGFLELTVADDGTGIPADAMESDGLGLHIMNYRARAIGGDLSVVACPNGGTLVRCQAPLPPHSAAENEG
jgi:two-component system, LuxR family, sensor kinase FixL